jgi:hypothetical protein
MTPWYISILFEIKDLRERGGGDGTALAVRRGGPVTKIVDRRQQAVMMAGAE